MKRLKRKMIIIGSALILFMAAGGFILFQLNKTDEGASVALSKPEISETEQRERETDMEIEETPLEEINEEKEMDEADEISDIETVVAGETRTSDGKTTTEEVQPSSPPVSETTESGENTPSDPSGPKKTGGLYFATREEAIAFGFSRFTQEEIDIFNRASAKGLTPEQEEMALQIAYSRFTAEEIAAIEEALSR